MENLTENTMENGMKNTEHQSQDDGLELLKRVIETNEKHIEESAKLNFLYEDFLSLLGEYESSFRGTTYSQGEVKRLMKEEKRNAFGFLEMLEATKVNLSKQSIDRLDSLRSN